MWAGKRTFCTPISRSAEPEEHLGPAGQGVMVDPAGDLHRRAKAPRVAVTPPTARMRKAERTVPCSAWARKRSRCTISRTSTPAQTNRVMTSAAWTMWRTSDATSRPTATSHERR